MARQKAIFLVLMMTSLFMGGHFFATRPALAATLTVDTLIDENDGSCVDGDCSLRDAVQVAIAGDTIDFSVSGTIVLTSTLTLAKNLTISGTMPISLSGGEPCRLSRSQRALST